MATTREQLRELIKQESRIKKSTDLDTFVDSVMDDILLVACQRARYFELFKFDTAITLIDEIGQYDLPDDFLTFKCLRFGLTATPTRMWTVVEKQDQFYRVTNAGYPKFFFLSGTQFNITPFTSVKATDTLLLDYYINPLSIFAADEDEFPVPRIMPMVRQMAVARVSRYHNDQAETQGASNEAERDFIATQGAPK